MDTKNSKPINKTRLFLFAILSLGALAAFFIAVFVQMAGGDEMIIYSWTGLGSGLAVLWNYVFRKRVAFLWGTLALVMLLMVA